MDNAYNQNLADISLTSSEVKLTRLDNGILVATSKKAVNTVNVSVFVNTGANNETEAENGISHFLEHMAFKGTDTRTPLDIVYEVEHLGASINAFTSRNVTAYHVTGLPAHIPTALDILSDVLKNSTFDEKEIATEKIVVTQEINEYADQCESLNMDEWLRTAFPNQASGRPILGSKETVASLTREMIADYIKRNYHADSMIVIGVGNVDHDQFVADASSRFSDIEKREQPEPEAMNYAGGASIIADDRFKQPSLIVSWATPSELDPASRKYRMLALLLGGGMSAPLFQEVREQRSLCYSVSAGVYPVAPKAGSLFYIDGQTTAPKIAEFLESAVGELVKVANGEINDSDWERVRNQIVMQVFRAEENAIGMARKIAVDIFTTGEFVSLGEIASQYAALTKDDVVGAAKDMIKTVPTISIYGDVDASIDYNGIVLKALGQ